MHRRAVAGLYGWCGSDAAQTSQNPETTGTASPESSEGAEAAISAADGAFVLPICAEPTTYTFWMGVSSYAVNYVEGLNDPDFYSADTFDGVNGLGDGQISAASGRPTTIAEVDAASGIEGIRIGPLDYPTPTGAEQIHVGGTSTTSYIRNSSVWSISTACEDPIPQIQLCDYLNTDEGIMMFNYGVENEDFVYDADGMPQ